MDAAAPAVLVVDDEADLLGTYRRLFARSGMRVVTASTCAAALRALGCESFAAAIVDLRLPDGDGLDIVRHARALASPPVSIIVTGFPSQHVRARAMDAGAADFFAKPFQAVALAARVKELAR